MKSFKDLKGREWSFHMTLATVRKVKSVTGVDLLEPESDEHAIVSLLGSPLKKIDLLWILVEQDAKAANVSRESFEDAIDGTLFLTIDALVNEELDFFIQSVDPTRAKLWTALLRKLRVVTEIQTTKMEAFLDSPELEQTIEQEMDGVMTQAIATLHETLGKRFIKLPASPA